MKKFIPFFTIFIVVVIFFWEFIFKGLLPVPSDTIVGLYNPFRDLYAKQYSRGVPFKNFLITDPVRQQYPWRDLSISLEKKLDLPLWNPYSFSGTPLLANLQSAAFYPMNLVFFILPFNISWVILIFLQPLLAGIFLYFYLRNIKLSKEASFLGAITFSFSGFSMSWIEWGTVIHSALWLPLILLSIDKIIEKNNGLKSFKNKIFLIWSLIYLFSLVSSFFAGHLQVFFYILILSHTYLIYRSIFFKKILTIFLPFLIADIFFALITSIQWVPAIQFILQSGRDMNAINWQLPGWFIPWENAIQFVSPDFYGNPATLNYFGVWNYGEFVGYIGIIPLIFAFSGLFKKNKETIFFTLTLLLSLIFAFPTFLAKIPFDLQIPLLSTTQPTRLIFVADFSLAILAAFGFDKFLKGEKIYLYIVAIFSFVFGGLWWIIISNTQALSAQDLLTSKRNLTFSTGIFLLSAFILVLYFLVHHYKRKNVFLKLIMCVVIFISVFDLFRFGWKFNPFTKSEYLFPSTPTIKFLQKNIGKYRYMTTDSRIFAPNFSVFFRLQSIEGYDPLYLFSYAQLVSAMERGNPNISLPFGFNRTITPHNYNSPFVNLLGVKYILSLSDIDSPNLKKVFQEGETGVYENKNVLPRAFFVKRTISLNNKQQEIETLYKNIASLGEVATVENGVSSTFSVGSSQIKSYEENKISIKTDNKGDGFLILTDTFYPTWRVKIDGKESRIYRADFNFRGVIVPKGKHIIEFSDKLF